MKTYISIIAAGLLASATGSAATVLIYNNGAPDQGSADSLSDTRVAEDFTSSGNFTLSSFEFWDVEGAAGSYNGSITWFLYTNGASTPGVLFAQGSASTASQITRTPTANTCCGGFGEVDNVINLTTSLTSGSLAITAGTYWIGLHDGPIGDTTFQDFYWETTSPGGGVFGQAQDLTIVSPPWVSTLQEHAFNISGTNIGGTTPEPASYALLLAGLTFLALLQRKQA